MKAIQSERYRVMSFYIRIAARQEPFPIGVDDQNRERFSVNFDIEANGLLSTWEKEIASRLIDEGLGTFGTDMFIGPRATIPSEHGAAGPYVQLFNTGGTSPEDTHDSQYRSRPSLQVLVTADGYFAAQSRALGIRDALHGIHNMTLTNTAGL